MKSRLRSIDCLRGAAALAVVCYHIWNRYFPELNTQSGVWKAPGRFTLGYILTFPTVQFGYIGVTLFFVLSGFCIHLPQARRFLAEGADGIDAGIYASRRFRRLYPAYLASLVLSSLAVGMIPAVAAVVHRRPGDFWQIFHLSDVLYNAAFLQFFREESLDFNGVYWTLLFEAQFYLVYPMLLVSYRRLGMWPVAVTVLAMELASAHAVFPFNKLFVTRWYEWFLGMWAAELYLRRASLPARTIAVLGLGAGIAAAFLPAIWPHRDTLLATGFFGLTLWIAHWENGLTAEREALAFRRLTRLVSAGVVSYSLYLIHVPVIDLAWDLGQIAGRISPGLSGLAYWILPLSAPASIALAWVFYRWFEEPFLAKPPGKSGEAALRVAAVPSASEGSRSPQLT